MIKTIVLDFGNVGGFFDYRLTTERLAAHSPFSAEELTRLIYGGELEDLYEKGHLSSAEFLREVRQRCRLRCSDEELQRTYVDMFWPNEEVCALVPRLRSRYRLLLGSNTTELHALHFQKQFADTLRYFEGLVLSYEVGARKPAAAFFERCHHLAGCRPGEVLFLDDLPANVAGAQQYGLQALLYAPGGDLAQLLAEMGVRGGDVSPASQRAL